MESAPLNVRVSSARDLKRQNKHDGARFFFRARFVLSALFPLRLCVEELSQF